MKNILIIGYGFVGQAVHNFLTLLDSVETDNVISIHDPAKNKLADFNASYDAVFVCVPTPQAADGACDSTLVENYFDIFKNTKCLILRSTVPPSTIEKLLKIKSDFVYMPEFLREAHWRRDSIFPERIVIGTLSHTAYCDALSIIESSCIEYEPLDLIKTTPLEASLYKYAANSFLAMKVVYMHELHLWVKSLDQKDSWDTLSTLMRNDSRFGTSHFDAPGSHGLGYSGSCLPKDTAALVHEADGKLSLLSAVIQSNKQLRNKNEYVLNDKK